MSKAREFELKREKRAIKCKCCNKEFEPKKELHYISRDVAKTGLVALGGGDECKYYDTFDCPECGCQNILGERKRTVFEESILKACDDVVVDLSNTKECKEVCLKDTEEEQSDEPEEKF